MVAGGGEDSQGGERVAVGVGGWEGSREGGEGEAVGENGWRTERQNKHRSQVRHSF